MGTAVGRRLGVLLLVLASGVGVSRAERSLHITLDGEQTGPQAPVKIFFDKRLTIVMPEPVQLAVAGSPDVLVAHVRDQVVVVTVVDSPYTRKQRPVSNVTVLTKAGTAFTCRIEIAAKAKEAPYDLIQVAHGPGRARATRDEAVELVARWLEAPQELSEPVRRRLSSGLEKALERYGRRVLAEWGSENVEPLADAARRNRGDFIYLTRHAVVRLGRRVVTRLTMTNRSQPVFEIASISLRLDGVPLPAEEIDSHVARPRIDPDGQPRNIGVVFPARALATGGIVEVRVCEGGTEPRCVSTRIN